VSLKLLLVDDSTTIQKIFKIALSHFLIEIKTANTLVEALNTVLRDGVDVIVIDANLTGLKGPEDFARLKQEAPSAPVLLLAGSHEPFDADRMQRMGYGYHLRKPFEASDIIQRLEELLGQELPARDQVSASPLASPVLSLDLSAPADGGRIPHPMQGGGMPQHFTSGFANFQPPDSIPMPPPPPGQRQRIPTPDQMPADLMSPPPPMADAAFAGLAIETSEGRLGRKAFADPPTSSGYKFSSASDDMEDTVMVPLNSGAAHGSSTDLAELTQKLEDFLRSEAPVVVRKAVEKYCEQHFSHLARDILVAELRRLAEEKARLLSS
jgi:CheY-like chemotaxis protein